MMDLLLRLLDAEYWAVRNPGPLSGTAASLYAALALVFAGVAALTVRRLASQERTYLPQRPARALLWLLGSSAILGLTVVAGRFLGVPGLSARIWPLTCLGLVIVLAEAYRWRDVPLPSWLADGVAVLTFVPVETAVPPRGWTGAGLVGHSLGLGLLLGLADVSPWLAPLVLVGLLAPQGIWMLVTGRRTLRLAPLAPLSLAYLAGGLVWATVVLDLPLTPWEGSALPDPWRSAHHVGGVTLAAGAWAWAAQLRLVADGKAGRWGAALLLGLGLAWGGATYLRGQSHGATGSDPYAYTQMAVDLAERGTLLHRFPLFAEVVRASGSGRAPDVAWHPLVPVGYNLPLNAAGDAASVWAPGFSALLAGAYAVGGERLMYSLGPLMALLAALVTAWLAEETLVGEPAAVRWGTAALAATLLLTSPEYLDRALVPMADGTAALFTTLALILALRLARRGRWQAAALAGAALGAAYAVRYTQIVLGLPVALAAWARRSARDGTPWLGALAGAAGAALVVAMPDVVYRWRTFGGPLSTGSTEIALLGTENVGRALRATLPQLWSAGEWGYLAPLVALGGWWLARRHRQPAVLLGSALAAVLGVHLLYAALRLRDLISVFPVLHVVTAYGGVLLLRRVGIWASSRRRVGWAALRLTLVGGTFLAVGWRSAAVLAQVSEPGWASFGYVTRSQRAAFEALESMIPEGGVVGASLGAGAVHLYTGRDICRPAAWSPQDLESFLAWMQARERRVYLLDDGEAMPDLVGRLGRRAIRLGAFDLPRFQQDGSPAWGAATLYQVMP